MKDNYKSVPEFGARNLTIDIVKGLVIILMVIGHSGAPMWVHDFIYMFHMPCFFIISGMLFKEKYLSDIRTFLIRKGTSLWRPFVVWTIIYILLHNLFFKLGFYTDAYSSKEITKGIVSALYMRKTEQLLGGFWFITSLLIASVLSLIWYKIAGMRKTRIGLGILLTLAGAIALSYNSFEFVYISTKNLMATSYFMTGTLLREIRVDKKIIERILIAVAFAILTATSFLLPTDMLNITTIQILPYYVVSTTASWALVTLCSYLTPNTFVNWLTKVGSRTLDILIFHFLVMKLISLIKIIHLGLPLSRLSDFPVIIEYNDWYWIAYIIAGVFCSLWLASSIAYARRESIKYLKAVCEKIKYFTSNNMWGGK